MNEDRCKRALQKDWCKVPEQQSDAEVWYKCVQKSAISKHAETYDFNLRFFAKVDVDVAESEPFEDS